MLIDVVHFTDAGCPWCYSAEPVRIALQERYGDQLRWRNVQVGVHESAATMEREGYTPAGLAEGYAKLHERHGMPFCARERPRLIGTWAGALAVKAAERQGAGERLLRRLRLAWFAEVRLVDESTQLRRLAAEVAGLDVSRFDQDLSSVSAAAAFERDREEAGRPDTVAIALEKTAASAAPSGTRYTTPSYVFSLRERSMSVPGFQPLEAYEVALHNLAPDLERHPAPDAHAFLTARPNEPHATVEIAAAIGRSAHTTREQLAQMTTAGSAVRTPVGLGMLWSAGPPAHALHCPSEAGR